MNGDISEVLETRMQPRLECVAEAVARVRSYLARRGLTAADCGRVEVGLVEAINNAVIHASLPAGGADVLIRAAVRADEIELEVRDAGSFEPSANWGELPDDPLAEHGRGGFLMRQAFAHVEHLNDAAGHSIRLRAPVQGGTRGSPPAEASVETLEGELRAARETVSGLRYLVSLLARSTTLSELIEPALAKLQELDRFSYACVRMVRRAHLELERGHGAVPELQPGLSIGEDTLETRAILTLGIQCVESTDALVVEDPLRGTGGPAVVVPVCFEDERLGTLAVVRERGEPAFCTGMVALVQTLAEFFGVAWATAQLQARERDLEVTARELAVAAEMQTRLLPGEFPVRADLRFSGACRSAQAVGGDFYDVFEVDGGTVVVIADAMGKGVPAAFVASVLRCAIRARAREAAHPGRLLGEVNRQIIGDLLAVDLFITALVGFLPSGAREVRVASAGHCPLVIRRACGRVDTVEGCGLPLGVLAECEYTTRTVELAPGDATLFFTDGLYEVGPAEELHLGLNWLRQTIGGTVGRDADDTVVELLAATKARAGRGPASDDRTLLVCQRVA